MGKKGASLSGVGVGVFVRDEFVREMKATPRFWVGATDPDAPYAQIPPCLPTKKFAKPIRREDSMNCVGNASSARLLRKRWRDLPPDGSRPIGCIRVSF